MYRFKTATLFWFVTLEALCLVWATNTPGVDWYLEPGHEQIICVYPGPPPSAREVGRRMAGGTVGTIAGFAAIGLLRRLNRR